MKGAFSANRFWLVPLLVLAAANPLGAAEGGLLVDGIFPNLPAERAGVQLGDRVLSYDGKSADSTYALMAAQSDATAKPEVRLQVRRGTQLLTLEVTPGPLGVSGHPDFAPEPLKFYRQAMSSAQATHWQEAVAANQKAIAAAREAGDLSGALWLELTMADAYAGMGRPAEAKATYGSVEQGMRDPKVGDDAMRAYCFATLGLAARQQQPADLAAAASWMHKALDIAAPAGLEVWAAGYQTQLGEIAALSGDWLSAARWFALARSALARLAPGSPEEALVLVDSGQWARQKGDAANAEAFIRKALLIRTQKTPGFLTAQVQEQLGDVVLGKDPAQAKELFEAALAIYRVQAPTPMFAANMENKLGLLAVRAEQWDEAAGHFGRLAEIHRSLPPAFQTPIAQCMMAAALSQLADAEMHHYKLDEAEAHWREAVALLRPNSEPLTPLVAASLSQSLSGLGTVAMYRLHYDEARKYDLESLALTEKAAPDSPQVAEALMRVARSETRRAPIPVLDDSEPTESPAAVDHARRAVALYEMLGQHANSEVAGARLAEALSLVAETLPPDDAGRAEGLRLRRRALAIYDKISPGAPATASLLLDMAAACMLEEDRPSQQAYLQRARAILATQEPGPDYMKALMALGSLAGATGDWRAARDQYAAAVRVFELLRSREPLPASRVLLPALLPTDEPYPYLLHAQAALKDYPAAFETMERIRARTLAEMVSLRNLDVWASASEAQRGQRAVLMDDRDAAYARLNKLEALRLPEEAQMLHDHIVRDVRDLNNLEQTVRDRLPHLAAWQPAPPLTCKQGQDVLEPGTLLLSFVVENVGRDALIRVFAVSRSRLDYHEVRVREIDLDRSLRAFKSAASTRGDVKLLLRNGRWLYDHLLLPAQTEITAAKRLLICPDERLHDLPFAALPCFMPPSLAAAIGAPARSDWNILRHGDATAPTADQEVDDGDDRRAIGISPPLGKGAGDWAEVRFLIEEKPLHNIASLGLYAAIGRGASNGAPPPLPLLALGDAVYEGAPQSAFGRARTAWKSRGLNLERLIHSKTEVETISRLYGSDPKLDRAATISTVLALAGQAAVLHFACHGLLDKRDAMASALALTPEDETQDGMLRADAVAEKLHLQADLVVLSACQTGLGQEDQNEGVIGLTRAFQIAGARNVVASLWSVADAGTAQFMIEFHAHYHAGEPADVALQAAQRAFLRDDRFKTYRHPYYWAPFLLSGHPMP